MRKSKTKKPIPHDELIAARIRKGYRTASDAARNEGWVEETYRSHENGTRGLKWEIARKYGRAYGVEPVKLMPVIAREPNPSAAPNYRTDTTAVRLEIGRMLKSIRKIAGEIERLKAGLKDMQNSCS